MTADTSFTVLDIETTASMPWDGFLVATGIGSKVYPGESGHAMTRLLLNRAAVTVVCHTNYDLRWMCLAGASMGPGMTFHDTKVMAWMLDSNQELALDALAARYLGYTPPKPIHKVQGRIMFDAEQGRIPIEDVPWPEMEAYNTSDLTVTAELYTVLRAELQERGIWDYFLEEEAPFSRLLVEMEVAGVPFDKPTCEVVRDRVRVKTNAQKSLLIERVGIPEFNPGSSEQLGAYLYEEVLAVKSRIEIPRLTGMTPERKLAAVQSIAPPGFIVDKVGRDYAHGRYVVNGLGLKAPAIDPNKDPDSRPTTAAKKLRVMHGRKPWVSDYLEWKALDKTLSSFLEKWPEQEHDGRIHGRFDQAGTVSGRLSAKEPNLQQVPTGGEVDVRQMFRGNLVIGDYSGLEARLGAHFSRDPVMMAIFIEGKDLYGTLAAEAWGGPANKSNERRSLMKVVWLSSQYGARGAKLAETLSYAGFDFSANKANGLLRNLENTMPRLFEWRQEVIDGAKAVGYVTTLAGRRRYLPELGSVIWKQMAKAERQAVNSVVQGSAADVVRRSMLAARAAVSPEEALLLLQVHDEMMWERGTAWRSDTFDRLKHTCETAHGFDISVPLIFEAKLAETWAEKGDGEAINLLEVLV